MTSKTFIIPKELYATDSIHVNVLNRTSNMRDPQYCACLFYIFLLENITENRKNRKLHKQIPPTPFKRPYFLIKGHT